jgi:predicted hotdog family 3-hydroxylacyl-ACP dehydratase
MTAVKIEDLSILDLLPQRPPFVMVDKLLHCDHEITKTAFTVREDNIFLHNGALSEAGLIENIAQSCAARAGNFSKNEGNGSVKIGFIGAIRNLEIVRLPKTDETMVTQINLVEEVFNMTLVNATVKIENEIIASGEMKISLTDKDG